MKSSRLIGVREKIARAETHFADIGTAIKTLRPKNRAPQTPPYVYDKGKNELIINSPPPVPLDPALPLMVGDYVHNLRSALDHLVYQLALLNGAPSEAATRTAFPIYLTPKAFKNFCDSNLAPFVSANAFTAIKQLQPYAAGDGGNEDVLWVLSQLDIIDKHRLLVVITQHHRPVHCTVRLPSGEVFDFDIPDGKWKPIEDGAEIFRIDLSKAIKKAGKVHVNLKTAKTVRLSNTKLICDEFDLGLVLADLKTEVTLIVNSFGKAFFGE